MTRAMGWWWVGLVVLLVGAAWLCAPSFGPGGGSARAQFGPVADLVDDIGDGVEDFFEKTFEDPLLSPFEDVQWPAVGGVRVMVGGVWYELLAIDGWKTADILDFVREEYGAGKLEKRFEEDLPMVLREGWKTPKRIVILRLKGDDGVERNIETEMTQANCIRLWQKRSAAAPPPVPMTPVAPGSGRSALDKLRTLLRNKHSYGVALGNQPALDCLDKATQSQGEITVADSALVGARALGLTVDGHAGVESPELLEVAPFLPALFVPLGDEPETGVVGLLADRTAFVSPGRPFVTAINGRSIEECLSLASVYVPDGSAALVRERACRLIRAVHVLGPAKGAATLTLAATAAGEDARELEVPLLARKPAYGEWPRRETGVLEDGTAYLRLASMDDEPKFMAELRASLVRLKDHQRLIIDVRGNGGGSREALRVVAGMLMAPGAESRVYNAARPLRMGDSEAALDARMGQRGMRRADDPAWSAGERSAIEAFVVTFSPRDTRLRLDDGEFGAWYYGVISPEAGRDWWRADRRVVVLMDNRCFSATDMFLSALKGLPGVTLVGRPSAGGSGLAMIHTLAGEAVRVRLSSMISFQASGELVDGVGVTPDVLVWPQPADFLVGQGDTVLRRALEVLGQP